MALIELVEKSADEHLVRETLAFAAERLTEFEVEAATDAPRGVRSPAGTAQRSGQPRAGPGDPSGGIDLAILRPRKGSWSPSFLEPCRTAEKALVAVIPEAYLP